MIHKKEKNNHKKEKNNHITQFYMLLTIISIVIMVVAAYITYGYQTHTIVISFDSIIEKVQEKKKNISVGANISRVPEDEKIEDILNDVIPNVCDDITDDEDIQKKCDKDPLSCLKEYEIRTIIVQNSPYQDHLFIKLMTGKQNDHLYTVVIDLSNNNSIIHAEGKIDKDRCRDVVGGVNDIFLQEGEDPQNSDYIQTQPKK